MLDSTAISLVASTTGAGPFVGTPIPGIWVGDTNGLIVTSATTVDGVVLVDAAGNLDAQNVVAGGTGRNIRLQATAGDLLAGSITATGDIVNLFASGAITDGDAGNDISALSLSLRAGTGIGGGAADPLETTVTNLAWNSGAGPIRLTNTGALTITTVAFIDTVTGGAGGGAGTGEIRATSPITIAADAITTGGMTYTAADSATNDVDHLTVTGAGTEVRDDTTLTLNAGDDLNIGVGTTVEVTGAAAVLSLNIDALGGGVADTGGETANLNGIVNSGGATILLSGGAQADSFVIDSNAVTTNDGGTVDNVQDNLQITGGGGADSLTLDDSGDLTGDTAASISSAGAGDGTIAGLTAANIAFIDLTTVTVNLSNGPTGADGDIITVTPNTVTAYTLNGNNPAVLPGDQLVYNGSGTKSITAPGVGTITGAGVAPVTFTNFERVSSTGAAGLSDDINLTTLPGGQDGLANIVRLERFNDASGEYLRIFIDTGAGGEQLYSTQLFASVNTITITGGTDVDRLVVDHEATGPATTPANSFISRTITFNAAGPVNSGEPNGDALAITGNPGFVAARTTYLVGATEDAGSWIIDPDGSGGAGMPAPSAPTPCASTSPAWSRPTTIPPPPSST